MTGPHTGDAGGQEINGSYGAAGRGNTGDKLISTLQQTLMVLEPGKMQLTKPIRYEI
jgi:hypothetical protein